MAACMSSTGTTAITAIKTPTATPPGSIGSRGGSTGSRYNETPRRTGFDLARASDDELVKLLGSPNVYDRDIAQRLLTERGTASVRGKIEAVVLE